MNRHPDENTPYMRKILFLVIFTLTYHTSANPSIAQNYTYQEIITVKDVFGTVWSPNSAQVLMVRSQASLSGWKDTFELLDIATGEIKVLEDIDSEPKDFSESEGK